MPYTYIIWVTSWGSQFLPYANNKGADQPVHPRSLISAFVIRCLDCIIPLVSKFEISNLYISSVAAQAGLSLPWSQTLKTGFVVTRLLLLFKKKKKKKQLSRDMKKKNKKKNNNKVTVRPVKTQISLGIRPVWPETSLSVWRKLGSLATHWAHSEDWCPGWSESSLGAQPFCWFCHVAAQLLQYFSYRCE